MFWVAIAVSVALLAAPFIAKFANAWLGTAINPLQVAGGFGILVAAMGARLVFAGVSSRSWRMVRGRIVESSVTGYAGPKFGHWDPQVNYRYTVDGCEFTGSRIAFGQPSYRNSSDAQEVTAKYRVGSQTIVYIRPSKPSVCVLEPGMRIMPLFYLIAGILLFLVSFADFPAR